MATDIGRGIGGRLRRVVEFDHSHTMGTKLLVIVLAAFAGVFASWLLADLLPRIPVLVLAALLSGYLLYLRPTRRGVVIRGLYGIALLLLLVPVVLSLSFLVLPHGTGQVSDPVPFVLTVGDLVLLVVFGILAAVPAGIAFGLEYTRGPDRGRADHHEQQQVESTGIVTGNESTNDEDADDSETERSDQAAGGGPDGSEREKMSADDGTDGAPTDDEEPAGFEGWKTIPEEKGSDESGIEPTSDGESTGEDGGPGDGKSTDEDGDTSEPDENPDRT